MDVFCEKLRRSTTMTLFPLYGSNLSPYTFKPEIIYYNQGFG